MRHDRADYDEHIQAPPDLIPEDEPVFLLRSKDVTAPDVVDLWATRAEAAGADPRIVASARRQAGLMRTWQAVHGAAVPTLPKGELPVPIRPPEELVSLATGQEVRRPSHVDALEWDRMSAAQKAAFVAEHGAAGGREALRTEYPDAVA